MKISKRVVAAAGVAAVLSVGTAGVVVAQGVQGKGPASVLSSLVKDGTLTQEQADKVEKALQDQRKESMAARQQRREEMIAIVTKVLGKSADEMKQEHAAGKSLAQIAGDKKGELITALVANINDRLDLAVKDGKLTAEQAERIKQNATANVTKMVDGQGRQGRGYPGGWPGSQGSQGSLGPRGAGVGEVGG